MKDAGHFHSQAYYSFSYRLRARHHLNLNVECVDKHKVSFLHGIPIILDISCQACEFFFSESCYDRVVIQLLVLQQTKLFLICSPMLCLK